MLDPACSITSILTEDQFILPYIYALAKSVILQTCKMINMNIDKLKKMVLYIKPTKYLPLHQFSTSPKEHLVGKCNIQVKSMVLCLTLKNTEHKMNIALIFKRKVCEMKWRALMSEVMLLRLEIRRWWRRLRQQIRHRCDESQNACSQYHPWLHIVDFDCPIDPPTYKVQVTTMTFYQLKKMHCLPSLLTDKWWFRNQECQHN